MKHSFYSHGKLLLTGEYLVLDDAEALALPTKKGQSLTITETSKTGLHWISKDQYGTAWYEAAFLTDEQQIKSTDQESSTNAITKKLLSLLNTARVLNPKFLTQQIGITVETELEFDRSWGLGSSSTLINNIAQWANVNAFALLERAFGGSGYDVACAQHNSPILYNRNQGIPRITEVFFEPKFKDHLFFIYLNQKQDSKDSIKHYQALPRTNFESAAIKISEINKSLLSCTDLSVFESLMSQHEAIISTIIKIPTIKSERFPDYPGAIKSLGGWGGDFILVTGSLNDMQYFKNKGYTTIISYYDMIV
ncbi:GYDIA family GHMP kinase [Aquimarina sp. W85]|uniref:GYDIA family GHMP kinase n=1 Tax=Aquimarina rhodophyticola TaxID=3342246 RepID=UPI00366C5E24